MGKYIPLNKIPNTANVIILIRMETNGVVIVKDFIG